MIAIHVYKHFLKSNVEAHPGKIHRKFKAKPCFGLREVKNGILYRHIVINCKETCYITTQKLAH